jgi:dihydrofolate reductase
MGYADPSMMRFAGDRMAATTAMLFGRRSYEDMLGYWTSTSEPNPFTEMLVGQRKYVASRGYDTALAYPNSILLCGEATDEVAALRDQNEVITVLGSGELVRALHAAGLVDEYVLQIHPVVLGSGRRLFAEGSRTDLTLVDSMTTSTGVVLTRYEVDDTQKVPLQG